MTNKIVPASVAGGSGFIIPAVILVYGPAGGGKTVDLGLSFPNQLCIASRGALQSVYHMAGFLPDHIEVETIEEATAAIQRYGKSGKYDAIGVDDFSLMAQKTFSLLEKKYRGYKVWGALRDVTLAFRNAARVAGCHIILNCWMNDPKTKNDGTFIRGGPMLSGKLPEELPALCDLVLKCDHESEQKPWTGVYRCEHSTRFVMKDRFNLCYDLSPIPMNLGEILRAAGYEVSRHPQMPWQEDVVERFALLLDQANGSYIATSNKLFGQLVTAGIDPKAAKWTMRDAMDRCVIRRSIASRNSQFITTGNFFNSQTTTRILQ